MAVPSETLRMPRLRGLHDFPEVAPAGSASEANNVEFRYGGPSRRRGTMQVAQITEGAEELAGKGVWYWQTPGGSIYVVVGYISLNDLDGYIRVYDTDGVLQESADDGAVGGAAHWNLSAMQDALGAEYEENGHWHGHVFHPGYVTFNTFLFWTGSPGGAGPGPNGESASAWCISKADGGRFTLATIKLTNRDSPGAEYWGGVIDLGADMDDPGPYLVAERDAAAGGGDAERLATSAEIARSQQQISGTCSAIYRNRVVIGGIIERGPHDRDFRGITAIRFSNVGDLEKAHDEAIFAPPGGPGLAVVTRQQQGWPADNIVFFSNQDPSPVVGLATWKDFLVVLKHRSLVLCRFTRLQDFSVIQAESGAGCVAARTVVSVSRSGREMLIFLSEDGVYGWDGSLRYLSRQIERTLRSDRSGFSSAHAVDYPEANQYWIFVSTGTNYYNTRYVAYVLDYVTGDWSTFSFSGPVDASAYIPGSAVGDWTRLTRPMSLVRLGAPWSSEAGIRLVQHDAGDADTHHDTTGVAYDARYETQRFRYTHHQVRRWRHLRLTVEDGDNTTTGVRCYWKLDNQDRADVTTTSQFLDVSTAPTPPGTFGSLTFGNAIFEDLGFHTQRVPLYGGPARHFRWGAESTANGGWWHINSAEVDTRRKSGRR